jgi:hypothetical protein
MKVCGPASGRVCGNEQMMDAEGARLRRDLAKRFADIKPARPSSRSGISAR